MNKARDLKAPDYSKKWIQVKRWREDLKRLRREVLEKPTTPPLPIKRIRPSDRREIEVLWQPRPPQPAS